MRIQASLSIFRSVTYNLVSERGSCQLINITPIADYDPNDDDDDDDEEAAAAIKGSDELTYAYILSMSM